MSEEKLIPASLVRQWIIEAVAIGQEMTTTQEYAKCQDVLLKLLKRCES